MTDGNLWDRQPEETAKAFNAFTVYRDLGSLRSIRQAAKALSRSSSLLNDWSRKYGWVVRADAYDAAIRAQQAAAYEAGIRAEAERWALRSNEQRDSEWEMARALMSKAGAMLRFPLAVATTEEGEDGKIVTIVTPTRWSLKDAATMAEVAAKLARLAADMAVPGGASVALPAQETVIGDADYIAAVLQRLDEGGLLTTADAAADEPLRAAPAAPTTDGGAAST
jgi:hypothetical protein